MVKSMGFTEGLIFGMNRDHKLENMRQVDWESLYNFIEDNKERIKTVTVGLAEDWNYTSGKVYIKSEGYINQKNTYVHACSSWATPTAIIEYVNGVKVEDEFSIAGSNSDSYFEFDKYKELV